VRSHGISKRRTWRKLHVGVDPESGEIQAAGLTENSVGDCEMVRPLLEQIEQPIQRLIADGSYDQRIVYDYLQQYAPGAEVVIPPRKHAHIWQHGNTKAERLRRDENLRSIRRQGKKDWRSARRAKRTSGYPVRSLAEATMFRLKVIFGDRLSAHLIETQTTQALIRCAALNRMTHLGMPLSYKVGA
jgi:Transposase DDE domain